jgi:hypothetical protein
LVIDPCRGDSPRECSEGDQAAEADELLGGVKSGELAGFGDQPDGAQRVDRAEAPQPGDHRGMGALSGELPDRSLQTVVRRLTWSTANR